MNAHLIVLAAGEGRRIGFRHKALLEIWGKPILFWSLKNMLALAEWKSVVIVSHPEDQKAVEKICEDFPSVTKLVKGSKKSRQESAYTGLKSIEAKNEDIVLFHNAANIFVKKNEIDKLLKSMQGGSRATFLGQTMHDTPKKVSAKQVQVTFSKQNLVRAQTPQAMQYDLAVKAYELSIKKNLQASDDVSLAEEMGVSVHHVECSNENFKITTNEDLLLAEKLIKANSEIVYGIGEDSHKFSNDKRRRLILGTVTIPNSLGLEADSDGDLILHATYNALSSAISKGSIGKTATLLCKKGVTDSKKYLCSVVDELEKKQFTVNNLSIAIEAAKPRLEKHLPRIKKALSTMLNLDKQKIGITVTSGDKLSAFGRGEGIRCTALVSLLRVK